MVSLCTVMPVGSIFTDKCEQKQDQNSGCEQREDQSKGRCKDDGEDTATDGI